MSKKYELTESDKQQLKPWTEKWEANALSTKPMDDADKEVMRKAIKGLYEAANIIPPKTDRIVFVSSPIVLRFAGSFAAALIYMKKNNMPINSTGFSGTEIETAAYAAAGISPPTTTIPDVTATENDTDQWYFYPIKKVAKIADYMGVGKFGLMCAQKSHSMWQGGNQWSASSAFISFFRYVCKLPLDYSKWDHYEKASMHGGPRIVHEDFCMISDRPVLLTINAQNSPHNVTGPFCQWSDGFSLFAINGTYVPAWVVQTPPEKMNVNKILQLKNVEQRLLAIKKFGAHNMLQQLNGKMIDKKRDEYELYELTIEGSQEKILKMKNPSEDKTHYEFVDPAIKTVNEALMWRLGWDGMFKEPVVKT